MTIFARLLALVAIVALLIVALMFSQRRQGDLRVSGMVEADEIRVGSRVGGRVKRVHAAEGQVVHAGDLLVELEPYDLLERFSQMQSLRAQSQATLDRLQAGYRPEEIAQARARVDQLAANLLKLTNGPRRQEIDAARAESELAAAEWELASARHARAESLYGQKSISREEYDTVTTELRLATLRAQVKKDALALLIEGTRPEEIAVAAAQLAEAQQALQLQVNGYRTEEIAASAAAVQASAAAEQVVQRELDELRITAPVEGTIEAVELQPGDLVGGNVPVISMMDTSRLWIRAYVPENHLHIRLGDKVPVHVDSYPGTRFHGQISFIARQAEFTPGNVQTPEERSQQVFRIKVTLLDGLDRLRPGMAADVTLQKGE